MKGSFDFYFSLLTKKSLIKSKNSRLSHHIALCFSKTLVADALTDFLHFVILKSFDIADKTGKREHYRLDARVFTVEKDVRVPVRHPIDVWHNIQFPAVLQYAFTG